MKTKLSRRLQSAILCLALLAAVAPFAIFAQAQPGAIAADSEKAAITVAGNFDGKGFFIFEGDIIEYQHETFDYPTGITINDKRWEDLTLPFELGFVPDFPTAKIVERQGRDIIDLTSSKDSFTLQINDSSMSSADYRVTISVAVASDRVDTPLKKQETIVKGTFDGENVFIFEGKTIRYLYGNSPDPVNLSVNGRPWTDLKEPFQLDYVPDRNSARIRKKQGRNTVSLKKDRGFFYLLINDTERNASDYQVGIVSLVGDETSTAPEQTAKPLDDSEVPITIEGLIRGDCTFAFQGSKIQYLQRGWNHADSVVVNGKKWQISIPPGGPGGMTQSSVPFELGFTPDFSSMRIVETKGSNKYSVNLRKNRFDLVVGRDTTASYYCRVTLAAKKQASPPAEDGANAVAPTEILSTQPFPGFPFSQIAQRYGEDYTTDGEKHRQFAGSVDDLIPDISEGAKMNQATITIEGEIDKKALFFIAANMILYQEGSGIGEYPRGVTVNGQPWKNLHVPFQMSVGVDPDSVSDFFFKTDDLEYSLFPASHHRHAVLSITNHGEPTKFQIRLVMLKKGGVDWRP